MRFARFVATFAAIAAIAAVVAAAPARAQQPKATLVINKVDASRFPELRIVVTALDARGVPATGLTAGQFQALDGANKVPVGNVQAAQDEGLRLATVIAIDTSGSMAGAPFERAQQAATEFVNSMGANDQAAIVAFNDAAKVIVGLTGDRRQLANGIGGLSASGGTALYEAVQTSAYIAAASGTPRRAIILLTDGENDTQKSTATADGSTAAAKGSGAPAFTIGMGATPDAAYLQSLATTTQGQYRAATSGTLAGVYADIAALLRNQYIVTIRAAGNADGADASVQVIAQIQGAPAGATATYKRGTAPVAAPQPTAAPITNAVPKPPGKKSTLPAIIFASVIVVIGLIVAGLLLGRWNKRRRTRLAQLRVIAPNLQQAAAQPLDQSVRTPGAMIAAGIAPAAVGTGILREKNGTGRVYELGAGPAIIGTSARVATIVLPPSDQIASEHARIWLRDGHYTLHHVGGMSRKTYVGGQIADWLVLEAGDELTVGPHKLIFEDVK